jgi:ATP-binding cassette subfamily B protein
MEQSPTLTTFLKGRSSTLALSGILAALGAAAGLVPYIVIYFIALEIFNTPLAEVDQIYVLTLVGLAFGAAVVKALAQAASLHLSHVAAYNLLYDLRLGLARKLGTVPLGFFNDNATGKIKKVIHEDVEQLEDGIAHMIPDLVAGITVPLLTIIVLFIVDWRMALATLATFPVAVGLIAAAFARVENERKEFYTIEATMNAAVIQYVNGMKVIKAFTRSRDSFAQLRAVIDEMRDFNIRYLALIEKNYAGALTLVRANLLTIVPVGALLYVNGSLDLPTFILFLLMGLGFNRPIFTLFQGFGSRLFQVQTASERVNQLFGETSLVEPDQPQTPKGYDIRFEDVHFSYHEGQPVLNGVSFTVSAGSVTALVGPSGAGKSTIAKLIPRFWEINSGAISIDGVDIRAMGTETLMEQVAFVFQDVYLFNDTVYENIRVGKPDASEDEIIAAAHAARCHDFISAMPQGYQTVVGEGGGRLSGGQKQRISIARAILKDAPIIVLDEATAFVDPENEAEIQAALAELMGADPAQPKTLVIVAHRLSTITGVDQILLIDEGEIAAQGTHEILLKNSDLYRQLWEAFTNARDWQFDLEAQPALETKRFMPTTDPVEPLTNPYAALQEDQSLMRQLWTLVAGRKPRYVRALVLKMFESSFIAYPTVIVFFLILTLFNEGTEATVWPFIVGLVVVYALQFVFQFLSVRNFQRLGTNVQRDMRIHLADHLRRLPMGFFTRQDTGTTDALFTTNLRYFDVQTPSEMIMTAMVVPTLLTMGMLALDWRMALTALLVIPFVLLILRLSSGMFARVWGKQAAARIHANSLMIDYIQGISVIRAFNLSGTRFGRFDAAMGDYRDASIRTQTTVSPIIVSLMAVLEIGYALFLLVGTLLYLNGLMAVEIWLLFTFLGLSFFSPLLMLGEMMAQNRMIKNAVRNFNAFLQSPMLPEPAQGRVPAGYDIAFEDVTFAYEDERVLKGANLTIRENTLTALVGHSGSGKTTITNLIPRFWDVQGGAVRIGGVDVREMTTDTLLSHITVVFQDVYLFEDTILNNIKFGNPNATEDQVFAAARAAQCHEFIMALPDGYQTVVGEGGSTLSGGQKQRIAIARAILKDAPIVLLDEATASIDPENERLIQQAFNALAARKTLIVIAHRLNTVKDADKIVVLDEGRVVQEGTHDQLLGQEGLYRTFWQARQQARSWTLKSESQGHEGLVSPKIQAEKK